MRLFFAAFLFSIPQLHAAVAYVGDCLTPAQVALERDAQEHVWRNPGCGYVTYVRAANLRWLLPKYPKQSFEVFAEVRFANPSCDANIRATFLTARCPYVELERTEIFQARW